MNLQQVGKSDLFTSRLSYGCMRIAGTWDPKEITTERRENGKKAVVAAYEAGYTLFDHADIYCSGGSEDIFGDVLKDIPSMRDEIVIATKCGIRWKGDSGPDAPHRYDFSKEHILWSCDESLKRLGVETIDLYQLHRPDLLMDPADIAIAFEKLHFEGKVRFFGVSNFSPSFVTTLQAGLPFPIAVNQVEIHLGRLDCFTDGTLDQCLRDDITPLAWSPLGGGFLGTGATSDDPKKLRIQTAVDAMAAKYGVSRTVMSLAWLLKHPSKIVPIVGSAKPENIRDAAKADEVELTREDWYTLLLAARGEALP
jgi:predicted oxidoreductase